MTGHDHSRAHRRRTAILTAMLLGSMLVAPGPLRAVDPVSAPPARAEMFRQPDRTGRVPARPFPGPVVLPGFHESTVGFSGLFQPTAIAFAPDGRVFIAEKRGVVAVFDSVTDTTPMTFADLTTNVQDFWDRGLLGLALDPDYAVNGRVYVAYTYNHVLGDPSEPPKWVDDAGNDDCPTPPGATTDGCVVSGRLSRLEPVAPGGTWDGIEHVLVEDWCQVHPSHSIGTLAFGPDGALYAGGGDGASFFSNDYGQDFSEDPLDDVTPDNPCGDPPSPVGTALRPPTAEGGSLRSQDLRTAGDPVGLAGTIIRVDPVTGDASPTNANFDHPDPNARRIIAYGLRNPFRFTFRPGTSELWIGDVGHATWEELNRLEQPTGPVRNFGWPCYEGSGIKSGFDSLDLCEELYDDGVARNPYFRYDHSERVVEGDACPTGPFIGGSVISGAAFYPTAGGPFPAAYDRALFFADYARGCIWSMPARADGLPDTGQVQTFASNLSGPVDLKVGPDGALWYVGFDDSRVHRITVGPIAVASANPTSSDSPPLHVQFDGSASTDPKGGSLAFAWDLDGDGLFDDSTQVSPAWDYVDTGVVVARLKVTDSEGTFDIGAITISVGNHEPVAKIAFPSSSLAWSVGDKITFGGSATDAEDGPLPADQLTWTVFIRHCPDACHSHVLKTNRGAGGSLAAPDHDFPSSIEIRLVATDDDGADSPPVSIVLQPKTVDLPIRSNPPGVALTVGDVTSTAPFTATVINKSLVEVSAPATATIDGRPYGFAGWSDGKAAAHSFRATASTPALEATYAPGTIYVPIAPTRVLDTRAGPVRPLRAGIPRTFSIAGTHGIPADAVAVTGNLTAIKPTKAGWIGLSTAPGVTPTTSALNLPAGDTRANGLVMLLGNHGRLTAAFMAQSGTSHVTLDITGYFRASGAGSTFTPLDPIRVLDSRSGIGGPSRPFVSGKPRSIRLGGANGIPPDAVAVTGNLTVTGQTAAGYVSMTTTATAKPAVSTINVRPGDTRANGLTIKLNGAGRANLVYIGGVAGVARADLIFDVTGFYRAGTAGLRFYPIAPRRTFDTRAGDSPSLRAGTSRTINVVEASTISEGARAVATNVTVVGQTAAGYLSITPQAATNPTTSTINFPLGDVRANNALTALNAGGRLRAIYTAPAGSRTHLILDLLGYFR